MASSVRRVVNGRRVGRWTHVSGERGVGWTLDGTDVALYYDPLDRSGDLAGCWVATGACFDHEHIDHYLDTAMAYVESQVEKGARNAL